MITLLARDEMQVRIQNRDLLAEGDRPLDSIAFPGNGGLGVELADIFCYK